MKLPSSKTRTLMIAVVFFGFGFASALIYSNSKNQTAEVLAQIQPVREKESKYKFIKPLLWYETPESSGLPEFMTLKNKLRAVIDAKMKDQSVEQVSLYYRDISHGWWVGIHKREMYAPASLLKVPLMMAYFKLAESDPEILQEKITYKGADEAKLDEIIKPREIIKPGKSYSVDELIRRMIIFSDNNATNALFSHLDPSVLNALYKHLGIEPPDPDNVRDMMTINVYMSFFRVLVNTTYLNRTFSEKALSLLSQSEFKDGIKAGVPKGVTVANKFGIRTFEDETHTFHELHDCAVVYHPEDPFFLCIMSRGSSLENLETTMRELTNMVYQEVEEKASKE